MISVILFLVFLAVTLFFGFVFAVALGERRIVALLPLSLLIGVNGYVFFLDLISYFVPIRHSFWLVLVGMSVAALGGYLILHRRGGVVTRGDLSRKQLGVLWLTALLVSLVSGIVALRTLAPDDLSLGHLSLAATITEGNFPVMDPSDPDYRMPYHYGPDLLAAALYRVARIPLWLGYDIQTILFSAAALLMAFLLAQYLASSFAPAFLGSLFLLYGGGLTWLNFTEGIAPLWQKFVLHAQVVAPWKFVAAMTIPNFDSSIVTAVNHTAIMGFPVMLMVVYLYFRALERHETRWFALGLVAALFFGYLALSLETNFIIVLAVFAAVWFLGMVSLFLPRVESFLQPLGDRKRVIVLTALVIGIGGLVAFAQGGILSTLGASNEGHAFVFVKHFLTSDITDKHILPFRLGFFQEFGLPLLLFVPAVILYRRDRRILFVSAVALAAFVAPLLVHYAPRPREMERLFNLSTPLFSFIAGLYLGEVVFDRIGTAAWRHLKPFITVAIFSIVFTSVLFQLVYIVTPLGYVGKLDRPFFATPPSPSVIDANAYLWIREHTTVRDRFFPYNADFVRDTGRPTPGFFYVGWGHPETIAAYRRAEASCDAAAFQALRISYLYVSPDFPIRNFNAACRFNLRPVLVYAEKQGNDFREIYRMR